MNRYLNFFDKRGDLLNAVHDEVTDSWSTHFDYGLVSAGIVEDLQVYVLEEVWNSSTGRVEHSFPIAPSGSTAPWLASMGPTGATEHFLYGFTAGATGDVWLVKDGTRQFQLQQQSYVVMGPTDSHPGMKVVDQVRSEAMQVNLAFHPSGEAIYRNEVVVAGVSGPVLAVSLYGEGEGEDERLAEVLQTLGNDIAASDANLFEVTDAAEPEPDWLLLNRKRKELVHEYEKIFPYVGSYKALINIIRYFGYTDVRLKEYWRNVDEGSKNFGKLRQTDIIELFDPRANFRDSVSVPSKVYRKTNMFGLFYSITRETGSFDDQGIPEVEEAFVFSPEEVLIKMYALKNRLKDSFLPLSAHIVDIVGEAVYFARFDTTVKVHQCRADSVSLSLHPSFEVMPSEEGWVQDLRPLYHFGCPVGPDLTLDGMTDLLSWRVGIGNTAYVGGVLDGIQTYRLVATIPGPTSYTVEARFERDPHTGQTGYAPHEIADGIVSAWRAVPELDSVVLAYQEGGTSGVVRFVQREAVGDGTIFASWFSNTTGVIPSGKYTLPGPTGGTALSINVSSGPSGTFGPSGAPVSYYSDCFVAYFDRISQGVGDLNDDEGIPVGCPVTLRNTTFDISWAGADVTFNQVDSTDPDQLGPTGGTLYESYVNSYLVSGWTSIDPHPPLPAGATYISIAMTAGSTGFPLAGFPHQNTYTWENLGHYAYYEMQWIVTYDGPGATAWISDSGRRSVSELETYPVILPYEGTYTVEVRLWDLYNTMARNVRHGAITVRVPDGDFIGWYRKRELDYTWETQRYPVQSDYSRLDRRVSKSRRLTFNEYNSTWDLPLHPNEESGMADLTFNSMDSIEFYQSAKHEPEKGAYGRDPYYFNVVEDSPAAWRDAYHLWWSTAGPKITQVDIASAATGPTGYVFVSLESCPYDLREGYGGSVAYVDGPTGFTGPVGVTSATGSTGDVIYVASDHGVYVYDGSQWLRSYARMEGFRITGLDAQPTYRDAVRELARQLNEGLYSDARDLPLLRSFIWYYGEEYAADYSLVPYVRGVSKDHDKHERHRFRWEGMSGSGQSFATNNFGYLGDIPTGFEVYSVPATGPSGSITLPGMTGAYFVGATNLVELERELNGSTAQTYPGLRDFIYNVVLGYSGWSGGSGPTGSYTEVKVQAVAKVFVSPQSIGVTYSGGIVGTVTGRSVVTNPTYDDLRILKYAQSLPLLSQVNFCYDNSAVRGKTKPLWKLTKEGDPSFEDRYSENRYFSHLFTQRGSYTLSLTVHDTNGNSKETTKRELLRID